MLQTLAKTAVTGLFLCSALVLSGCSDVTSPQDIVGTYDLVLVNDAQLPVTVQTTTYFDSELTLLSSGRFEIRPEYETCLPSGSCSSLSRIAEGTWNLLNDGATLQLNHSIGLPSAWSKAQVNGDRIVFCADKECAPRMEYRRTAK